MIRKFFYFIGISCLNAVLFLYDKLAWGDTFAAATTAYASRIPAAGVFLARIAIVLAVISGIFHFVRFIWRKFKSKRSSK